VLRLPPRLRLNDGTSPATAIKSLSRASGLPLGPGDRVLLQRGGTFSGKLAIWRNGTAGSPITIDAYGSGANPVVTGDCLRISGATSHLHLRSVRPSAATRAICRCA
jgi:hypothetical protein